MLERKQMKRENGIGEVGGKGEVKSNEGKLKKKKKKKKKQTFNGA